MVDKIFRNKFLQETFCIRLEYLQSVFLKSQELLMAYYKQLCSYNNWRTSWGLAGPSSAQTRIRLYFNFL